MSRPASHIFLEDHCRTDAFYKILFLSNGCKVSRESCHHKVVFDINQIKVGPCGSSAILVFTACAANNSDDCKSP